MHSFICKLTPLICTLLCCPWPSQYTRTVVEWNTTTMSKITGTWLYTCMEKISLKSLKGSGVMKSNHTLCVAWQEEQPCALQLTSLLLYCCKQLSAWSWTTCISPTSNILGYRLHLLLCQHPVSHQWGVYIVTRKEYGWNRTPYIHHTSSSLKYFVLMKGVRVSLLS